MKSRIFTPHNPASETAIAALNLRNAATPFGMGALIGAVLAAQTIDVSAFIHSNGTVEVVESLPAQSNYFSFGGQFILRTAIGSGDLRSKTITVIGDSFTVTSAHDEDMPLNAVSALIAKPVAPTYTILGAVNDICDKLDDILEGGESGYTAWTVVVNQADQSIVFFMHNGFNPLSGAVAAPTLYNNAGQGIAELVDEQQLVLLDRFVGTVPSSGNGGAEVRPHWE